MDAYRAVTFTSLEAFTHSTKRGVIMLVLSRKRGESIVIDGQVIVTVIEVRGDKVRLGVEAPKDVRVDREEIHQLRSHEAVAV